MAQNRSATSAGHVRPKSRLTDGADDFLDISIHAQSLIDGYYGGKIEQAAPGANCACLVARYGRAFDPEVVSYIDNDRRMLQHRCENRPRQQLFVANENRRALIPDRDCPSPKEIQWHAFRTERAPHAQRHWDALNERVLLGSSDHQRVLVGLALRVRSCAL